MMTKRWHYHTDGDTPYHVWPADDLIERETNSDDCVCGPCVTPIKADDGRVGWILTHHALDGRERGE